MSRTFILIFGLSLLPALAHGQVAIGSSLVTGGDFESGLSAWTVDWGNIASLNSSTPLSGSTSLRLTVAKGGHGQLISGVEAGATYRISGVGRLSSSSDVATIGVNFVNAAGTVVVAQWIQVLSTVVQNYSFDVVAPAGISQVQLYAFKNVGTQPADFDNFNMVKIANP